MKKRREIDIRAEKTEYIEAHRIKKVEITSSYQIRCKVESNDINDKLFWNGEIQKIYLDNDGKAYAYDVYIY